MTAAVPVEVSGELTVSVDDLPPYALELIKSALTVPNEDREKALAEKVFGAWDMPEFITLYREETHRSGAHVMRLPRGFAKSLVVGLRKLGVEVEWDDRRARVPAELGYFKPFELRSYQARAVGEMLAAEQGVYECPAGGGKTVTIFGLMAYAQQRSLWITDKTNLAHQARERAMAFLGLEADQIGFIGDDRWVERDLTICLRQTLWARLWEIEATDWFNKWGVVFFDECHRLAGDTLGEVCRKTSPWLLLGASATPAKTETRGKIVNALIGPTVALTPRQELYDLGVLMRPSVEVVRTHHDDVFWPTHDSDAKGKCQDPGCDKTKKHSHRNNYATVLKNLTGSASRNAMIARKIASERGHVHLVFSRQLKHLDIIRKAVIDAGWDGPIYLLRGEENAEGLSQAIAGAIEDGGFWETYEAKEKNPETNRQIKVTRLRKIGDEMPHGREAVVFSTIADEGLDIPPVDRVHLVFPMRQDAAVIQVVGRGERIAPSKDDSVIVDYVDRCSVFAEQSLDRDRVYRATGYQVKEVGVTE